MSYASSLNCDTGRFNQAEPSYQIVKTFQERRYAVHSILEDGHRNVALDVKHSYDIEYRRLTCLVQLATPNMSYLIDLFGILRHMHMLNEIFTNANILKVLQNADQDACWLQGDFGVYIVDAFDTEVAVKDLNFPGSNFLANLVYRVCGQSNFGLNLFDGHCRLIKVAAIQRISNFSRYNLKEDLRRLQQFAQPEMENLPLLLLAWRDIMARFLNVGKHYLIFQNSLIQDIFEGLKITVSRLSTSTCRPIATWNPIWNGR
ncbi:hypothetical protein Esti_004721 [Eimeria stiedai]